MHYQQKDVTLKNNLKVTIKTIQKNQAVDCISFLKTLSSQTNYMSSYPEEQTVSVEEEEAFIQKSIANQRQLMLACIYNQKIIANISLNPISNRQKMLHRATMGIGVLKEFQNLGIASILISEVIILAKEIGYEQIELEVVVENQSAIHLYQKMGFEITGTIKRAFKLKNGSYFDFYTMVKFL